MPETGWHPYRLLDGRSVWALWCEQAVRVDLATRGHLVVPAGDYLAHPSPLPRGDSDSWFVLPAAVVGKAK